MTAEERRLLACLERKEHWKRWGPYLSERAWGTVREDYSSDGRAWEYLPHDHARYKTGWTSLVAKLLQQSGERS